MVRGQFGETEKWSGSRVWVSGRLDAREQKAGQMAILTRGAAPESGPDSFDALDRALLAGFVVPGNELSFGKLKIAAGRMRARVGAVELWLSKAAQPSHKELAKYIDISDRCLSYQFPKQSELYAFPPPELARSLAGASVSSLVWSEIGVLVRPVFEALETNIAGRSLMAGLVIIHRANPALDNTDAYFTVAMSASIRDHRPRRTSSIADLFTGGVRMAFEDWVDAGQPNLEYVADRVDRFLAGPVNDAYESLLVLKSRGEHKSGLTKELRK